jgi:hypothetical protein
MGELNSTSPAPTVADLPVISSVKAPSSPFVRLGGLLGIAGTVVGLVVLVLGCAGIQKALMLSRIAVGLGAAGLLFTFVGALFQRRRLGEDTHVLQALFACVIAIGGGLLEMAAWLNWSLFK